MKKRAYITIAAGTILIAIPAILIAVLHILIASHGSNLTAAQSSAFALRSDTGLGLISSCGAVAIANAVSMLRSGKANVVLTFGTLALFIAGAFALSGAASAIS